MDRFMKAVLEEELDKFNTELSGIEIHRARLREGLLELSDVEAPPKK